MFDPVTNTLATRGARRSIEPKPARVLLRLLAGYPDIVGKEELLGFAWPEQATGDDVLTVAVSQLRKALDDQARAPRFIKTVPGQGYQLVARLNAREHKRALAVAEGRAPAPEARSAYWIGWAAATLFAVVALLMFVLQRDSGQREQLARNLLAGTTKAQWQEALAEYEQMARDDPDSVPALVGMVEAQWKILADQPQLLYQSRHEILGLLRRAAAIRPESADLHWKLGHAHFSIAWDLAAADEQFSRALAIDPNLAPLHLQRSQLQLAMGDFAASARSLERSRELDPSLFALEMAVWIYNMQRQYELAELELERLMALRPDTLSYHVSAQSLFENMGDEDRSFQHLLATLRLIDYSEALRDEAQNIFARGGLAGVYRWLLMERRESRNMGQYRPPLAHARFAIRSGDHELALRYLEEALMLRQNELLWIGVDPKYDPLRHLERFQALVHAVTHGAGPDKTELRSQTTEYQP